MRGVLLSGTPSSILKCIVLYSVNVIEYIVYDINDDNRDIVQLLLPSLEEASTIQTQQLAKEYMIKYLYMSSYHSKDTDKHKKSIPFFKIFSPYFFSASTLAASIIIFGFFFKSSCKV